jgi:hypothetical protein
MDSSTLKAFLQLGILIGGCSFVMIFMQPPNSPEFVLSVCSSLMGFALIVGVWGFIRIMKRG